jgi:hypothetical protein
MVSMVLQSAWKMVAVSLLLQFTLPEKKITLIISLHLLNIWNISSHANNNL